MVKCMYLVRQHLISSIFSLEKVQQLRQRFSGLLLFERNSGRLCGLLKSKPVS
ncbi:hypothetical protein Plhal304r1_c014g0054271 [Plasmopara halstedii]